MIQDHLDDIDFRTWSERSKSATEDFVNWYNQLHEYADSHDYDERIQGQLLMLSSVLWYLLDPKDYKKLVKLKATPQT